MRHFVLFVLLLTFLAGSAKKKVRVETEDEPEPAAVDPAAERERLFSALKSTNETARQNASEELSTRLSTDPDTAAGLVVLLKDTTNAGLGKTHPLRITSTREAVVRTLLSAGPKGEAILQEKGLPALREGLSDTQPAVREHTAYAIGLIGPIARPLSAAVMK